MDRERVRELLPILEAFAEGKDVEFMRPEDCYWTTATGDLAFHRKTEYRIKPEPREFWLDTCDFEVMEQKDNPAPLSRTWIKVREVLED